MSALDQPEPRNQIEGIHLSSILVTGGTGFTGRYLVSLLKQRGRGVVALSSQDLNVLDAPSVRSVLAEQNPDYVVHLAGTPNVPDSEAEKAFALNVGGTVNLLDACARLSTPPRKIVLASSSYVYGDTGSSPASEDAHLRPLSAYGKSKLEMERAAARWFGHLPILIVRPFNYTGIGHESRFLVPKLVLAFQRPEVDVSFVDPNVVRDYSDVRWIARVYAGLLESSAAGIALNACSGIGTPLTRLVTIMERLTGRAALSRPPRPDPGRSSALVGSPNRLMGLVRKTSTNSIEETLRWMVAGVTESRQAINLNSAEQQNSYSPMKSKC